MAGQGAPRAAPGAPGATLPTQGPIAPLAEAWEALADAVDAAPFERPGWVAAWWEAFGSGDLNVFTVERAGELRALLPLVRRGSTLHSPANEHSPALSPLALDEQAARDLVRSALIGATRVVSMDFVDAEKGHIAAWQEAAADLGWRTAIRGRMRSPFVALEDTWEGFEQSLSANVRGAVGRRRRRREECGSLEFVVETGAAGVDALLQEGFTVEASGWKGADGTAMASSPETRTFYTAVARWAAARGTLRLAFLRLDGQAIAFHLDIEEGAAHYHVKGGYDAAFARFSPGKLLHHLLLERAFGLGLSRYEFLGAVEPYKAQWANREHPRVLVRTFAPTAGARAAWVSERYGRPILRRVRRALTAFRSGKR